MAWLPDQTSFPGDRMFDDLEGLAWLGSTRSLTPEKVMLLGAIEAADDDGQDSEAHELRCFFSIS